MTPLKEQIQNLNALMETQNKDLNKSMAAAHIAMLGATMQDDSVTVTDEDILSLSQDLRKMAVGGLAIVLIQALQE